MAISQMFYDLEREVRNKYGEQWHYKLDADHPMVVAMRSTLEPEVLSSEKTFKKPKIRVMKNGKHVNTVKTIKECVAYTGLARDTISRRLRGLVPQKGKKWAFHFEMEDD